MRHLYAPSVKAAALFRGCSPLFLDALLATTHVELYMPAVGPGRDTACVGRATWAGWGLCRTRLGGTGPEQDRAYIPKPFHPWLPAGQHHL